MGPEVEKIARNIVARRLAADAGKDWGTLPLPERRERLKAAEGYVTDGDRERAVKWRAKKLAEEDGVQWNAATVEQRKSYTEKARQ
jgi:hypothetical protein